MLYRLCGLYDKAGQQLHRLYVGNEGNLTQAYSDLDCLIEISRPESGGKDAIAILRSVQLRHF